MRTQRTDDRLSHFFQNVRDLALGAGLAVALIVMVTHRDAVAVERPAAPSGGDKNVLCLCLAVERDKAESALRPRKYAFACLIRLSRSDDRADDGTLPRE